MSADVLIEKAKSLRTEKKYAEAMLAARQATRADPENADAWWQLGLATQACQGLGKALDAYKKTAELAPGFGSGWQRLGMAEADVGKVDDAKVSLRLAFELDSDLDGALDTLAELAEQTQDADDELWALEHLADQDNLSSRQCNRLGILHHNRSAYAQAIHFYRRCAQELDDPAGWINLGLVLSDAAVSQDAEAVDVLRRGQRTYPDRDRFKKMLDGLLPRLLKLADAVRARDEPALGLHEQYQHYINPIELLRLGDQDLDDLSVKEVQRAKRRLLQEIDLEDGKISWMSDMVIDRSRALTICDEIVSGGVLLQHHLKVYRDKRLRGFLCRGEPDHFLVTPFDEEREAQEAFDGDQSGFGDWLSPIFAAQYNLVLGKMIEKEDILFVECLLDGRRWVKPLHDESCFEQARRLVSRLIDEVGELRALSESEKISPSQLQSALAKGKLGKLLELLPNHFSEELSRTFYMIRGLSIDANNRHDDPDTALSLLESGRSLAMKSAQLRHHFEEDSKRLAELKSEADKQSAKLVMGGKPLEITRAGARLGERFIKAEEVTSLRWGAMANAGGREGMAKYAVVVAADRVPPIVVEWTTKETKEQDDFFNRLTHAGLLHLMPRCIENLEKELNSGQRVRIGPAVATRNGLEVKVKGWFSDKDHVISWSNIKTELRSGVLTFTDQVNSKATAIMGMMDTDNAVTLHWMIKLKGKE